MMVKATMSVHLIGAASVAVTAQREGRKASLPVGQTAGRRVRAQPHATNAWNQNWDTSGPGYQSSLNKANVRRVRAVRRPGAPR